MSNVPSLNDILATDLKSTQKLTLIVLAWQSEVDGTTAISYPKLASLCGVTPVAMIQNVKKLEQANYLTVRRNNPSTAGCVPNSYIIKLPKREK